MKVSYILGLIVLSIIAMFASEYILTFISSVISMTLSMTIVLVGFIVVFMFLKGIFNFITGVTDSVQYQTHSQHVRTRRRVKRMMR